MIFFSVQSKQQKTDTPIRQSGIITVTAVKQQLSRLTRTKWSHPS